MPDIYRETKDEYHLPKGVSNRNKGLHWILKHGVDNAVVYFADDDNTYDLRLFHEVGQFLFLIVLHDQLIILVSIFFSFVKPKLFPCYLLDWFLDLQCQLQ